MEPSNEGPALMRSVPSKPNNGLRRRSTPYPTRNDNTMDRRRHQDRAENNAAIIGVILVVILVVVIAVVVIWLMMRSKKDKEKQSQCLTSMTLTLARDANGKILIAEGGKCNTTEDCRSNLRCFSGQCRSTDTIKRVEETIQHPKPTPQQQDFDQVERMRAAEKEKEERLEEYALRMKAEKRKKEEKKHKQTRRYRMESAMESGLKARLRPPSATSEAEQDFGW